MEIVKFKKDSGNGVPGMPKYYGMVKKIMHYLVCALLSFLVSLTIIYILSELQVFWYMRESHMIHRSDLGDDLGFGLLGLLLVPAFIICLPSSFFIIWKLLKKFYV